MFYFILSFLLGSHCFQSCERCFYIVQLKTRRVATSSSRQTQTDCSVLVIEALTDYSALQGRTQYCAIARGALKHKTKLMLNFSNY